MTTFLQLGVYIELSLLYLECQEMFFFCPVSHMMDSICDLTMAL